MLPLTPAQSWAFLALLGLGMLWVIWLVAHVDTVVPDGRGPAAADPSGPGGPSEPTIDDIQARPVLRLVEGSSQPPRGPSRVYDWAVQGI